MTKTSIPFPFFFPEKEKKKPLILRPKQEQRSQNLYFNITQRRNNFSSAPYQFLRERVTGTIK